MRLVLATRNPGKVAELAARLPDAIELVSAAEIHGAPDVVEDAPTLIGNAEKKARALYAHTGLPSLADDTGLEVDALGGAPGVRSARFASETATDAENRTHLLRQLESASDRAARFRTVLAYVDADGLRTFDGVCDGVITSKEIGDQGFGYDSLFRPVDGDGRTFAEMAKGEKNDISHRGRALDAFTRWLRDRSDEGS
ncbi:MAG: RdgB/HAM1 family non-canonical purine NTP pyrophosphatase [Bacteroidota bacterium]